MSSPRVSWPLSSVYFLAASALAVQSLDLRSEQTQAQCSADFDWAENSLKLTPCLLAAYVWGSCFTGSKHPGIGVVQLFIPSRSQIGMCRNLHKVTRTPTRIQRQRIFAAGEIFSPSLPPSLICVSSSWAAYNLLSACTACQGFDSAVEK